MSREQRQIYLFCGSGGVGKTTLSASVGLMFALQGKKVVVLTIDPAKRLADSLGIKALSDSPQKIDVDSVKKNSGELWAMMLDTKRTFDLLIEKYSSSQSTRDKIFNNKIYQQMSKMLAGSQEYMAMEKLYDIHKQSDFDVIIVDTPPMQNAVDFLKAPEKMMNMISNSMLHLLLKPTMGLGKKGFKFFEKGSRHILKIFDRITGFAFLQDISEMLIAFQDLIAGFEDRARKVQEILLMDSSQFIAVCTTQTHSISEMQAFSEHLSDLGYHLKKIICNRVYTGDALTSDQILKNQEDLLKYLNKQDAKILVENYRYHLPLIKRDQKQIQALANLVGKNQVNTVPLFHSDIHDLEGLHKIAKTLAETF